MPTGYREYHKPIWVDLRSDSYYPFVSSSQWKVVVNSKSEFRRSGVTANFRHMKTNRLLDPVPMSLRKQTRDHGTYSHETWDTNQKILMSSGTSLTTDHAPFLTTSSISNDAKSVANELAIQRFRKAAVGAKANLILMLAEARKTANTLADLVYSLSRAFRAILRGDVTGFIRWTGLDIRTSRGAKSVRRNRNKALARDLSSAWLQVQYGLKPLIHDIADAAKLLESTFTGGIHMPIRGQGRQYATKDLSSVAPGIRRWGGWSAEYTVRYGGVVRLQDPGSYALANVGFTNPLVVAWELVPYSFVVDWVLPIVPYLERLNELDGLVLEQGYKVVRQSSISKGGFGFPHENLPIESRVVGGDTFHVEHDFRYDLEGLSTFPSSIADSWPPKVKGWLEGTGSPVTRVANAVALMYEALTRRGWRTSV